MAGDVQLLLSHLSATDKNILTAVVENSKRFLFIYVIYCGLREECSIVYAVLSLRAVIPGLSTREHVFLSL